MSEEKKNIKREYARNRYHQSAEIKTKMNDYAKNRYRLMSEIYKKSKLVNHQYQVVLFWALW